VSTTPELYQPILASPTPGVSFMLARLPPQRLIVVMSEEEALEL